MIDVHSDNKLRSTSVRNMTESRPTEQVLHEAVMSLTEPVLFQNLLKNEKDEFIWQLLQWDLSEIGDKFGDVKLPFRTGFNAKSKNPQWEHSCSTKLMTFTEFLQLSETDDIEKQWYYFDYKYMQEWFKDKSDILSSLNWKKFGFDKDGSDSTLWIGSKGAHTNCHQDSYGCNLVAQIHGRKEWILFPPTATNFLKPTRLPYEESTVYSSFNFFSPSKEVERTLLQVPQKPRTVKLEKGDVLFVPNGWWHYVESEDLSISVNIWLPMVTDSEARIKEAIVKLLVSKIGKSISGVSEDTNSSLSYCLQLLDAAVKEYKTTETPSPQSAKKMKRELWTAEKLAGELPNFVKTIPELGEIATRNFWSSKRERFTDEIHTNRESADSNDSSNPILLESLVKALCHPDVINKVADFLITS